MADVFVAIAHPIRRQILDLLRTQDQTVKSLSGQFDVSRPAVSQHLAILLEAGLVAKRESGRESYYHLQPDGFREVEAWMRHYRRFWNTRLDALGDYLDEKYGEDDGTTGGG